MNIKPIHTKHLAMPHLPAIDSAALRAVDPFNDGETLIACPKCRGQTLHICCDEPKCTMEASCGTPTAEQLATATGSSATLRIEQEHCPKCTRPGIYIRRRYFESMHSDVWMCNNDACSMSGLYWHRDFQHGPKSQTNDKTVPTEGGEKTP